MMRGRILGTTGIALLCAFSSAQADKDLAHSKSLGMSFTAVGEPWCAANVDMRVQAQDAGKFATPEYATIIQKLGQVLGTECPQVESIAITGLAAGQTVWNGTASKAGGWEARQQTLASPPAPDASAAAPASAASPAVAMPAPVAAPVAEETGTAPVPQTAAPDTAPPAPEAVPPAPAVVAPAPPAAAAGLEIAGWRPGGLMLVGNDARALTEIPAQENGCRIRTYHEIRPDLNPSYKMSREFSCENGYAQSADLRRQARASLYYLGQSQPFGQIDGFWFDGYALDRGRPRQIVARYQTTQQDVYRRAVTNDRLLAWTGEDRDLRAHFFASYVHDSRYNLWRLDQQTPYIVLTDSAALHQSPEQTGLATALAEMHKTFLGYSSTDQFNSVGFIIVDQLHNAPGHKQLDASIAGLDPSLHKQGQAVRHRGMPWSIDVKSDFAAMRVARAEAERQRAEAEQQRLAALRAQHQSQLDNQYRQLAEAGPYDQLRFYATLMLARAQLDRARIDFTSNRYYGGAPLDNAVAFMHPAQFAKHARDGEVALNAPMYLLVEADDGAIEKPYPMVIDYNESEATLDGWMLVKLAPKFGFGYDDKGKPVFEVTVQEAVACETELCLKDTDAKSMMQIWYDDQDMNFAMTEQR